MFHLGLIGFPLGHSRSPILHQAALRAMGVLGEYTLYPVEPTPEGLSNLEALLNKIRLGNLHGLNVTIPHKQTVLGYMDHLSAAAKAIGAVNTIYARDGELWGENTDAPGFIRDLERFLHKDAGRVAPGHALILGAGGSARAVVYALQQQSWHVTVAARRLSQAKALVNDLMPYAQKNSLHAVPLVVGELSTLSSDLIVNTTPVGMAPNTDLSPWPETIPFPKHTAIYDLVYNPTETLLVRLARSQGLAATTGMGMLIEQAALALEAWTNLSVPRSAMFAVVTH